MQSLPGRMQSLLLITPLLILSPAEGSEEKWSIDCPSECSCHLSHFKDLPMRKWLNEESTGQRDHSHETYEYNNEAMYSEDTIPQGFANEANDIVRMAICILQKDSDPGDLLGSLPPNLEVLTILQSQDSKFITLEANIFHHLMDLVALEIQGFHSNGDDQVSGHHGNSITSHYQLNDVPTNNYQPEERIILNIEAIHHLHSLQYLNLQYVKVESDGQLQYDYRPTPIRTSGYKYDVHDQELDASDDEEQLSHHLVFLSPEPEAEVLPYNRYRQEQEKLKSSFFIGLPSLVFLRLYACGLKEVTWKMFDGLPQLTYLSLEENDLRFIPEFTFYGAPNLKTLSLAYNKLLSLQSTSLAGLLELRKLDLSHNNFSHLSELSLPPFPHLKTADFRYNPIETVFSSTFEIMNATEILYLGGDETGIEIIQSSFAGLNSLIKLFIHNVKIDKLERVTLMGMPVLKELEMKGSVNSIEFDALALVPNLQKLTLKHCNIKTISMDAFYGAYQILYLDLSYNQLETLPPGIFDQQSLLKELLLQNNKFKELPEKIFQHVAPKMIRLDGNPWHCTCLMLHWRETSINKVKERVSPQCQHHYDKGVSCRQPVYKYTYDKRVAPQCETPAKYRNWNVFYVLRKAFRCKKANQKSNEIRHLHGKYIARLGLQSKNVSTDSTNILNKKVIPHDQNDKVLPRSGQNSLIHEVVNKMENGIIITPTTETKFLKNFTNHITETTAEKQGAVENVRQMPGATDQKILATELNGMQGIKQEISEHDLPTDPGMKIPDNNQTQVLTFDNSLSMNKSEKNSNQVIDVTNNLENDLMNFLHLTSGGLNATSSINYSSNNGNKSTVNSNSSNKFKGLKKSGELRSTEKEFMLYDGNKSIKVSKKAYKLEMERQAKESHRTN